MMNKVRKPNDMIIRVLHRQPYDPSVKFQYGDWLRVSEKKKLAVPSLPKGRIRFHDTGGSSSNVCGFSYLGTGLAQGGSTLKEDPVAPPTPPADSGGVPIIVVPTISVVDLAGATTSEVVVATTAGADGGHTNPILVAFNGWLAGRDDGADLERRDSTASLLAKRASGGSDPPKTKRARPNSSIAPL
ncbi:hypothetical protein V6N13_043192 [Hibiscus sabdariffa]